MEPDTPARILIDERSGIIVMGENVRISGRGGPGKSDRPRSARTRKSRSPTRSAGETVVVPRTSVEVDDQSDRRMVMLEPGVTLKDLVEGLNALGVGPRDMISIVQAIKAAGALQADIEVMTMPALLTLPAAGGRGGSAALCPRCVRFAQELEGVFLAQLLRG